MARSSSSLQHISLCLCPNIDHSLDSLFWRAYGRVFWQRVTVHIISVGLHFTTAGHEAPPHHCLPPAVQWPSGTISPPPKIISAGTSKRPQLVRWVAVGTSRNTNSTKGGLGCFQWSWFVVPLSQFQAVSLWTKAIRGIMVSSFNICMTICSHWPLFPPVSMELFIHRFLQTCN